MLRIHCLQQRYSLSNPAMEDVLYEVSPMRMFSGRSLDRLIPDQTTVLHFRHFLERHPFGRFNSHDMTSYLLRKSLQTIIYLKVAGMPDHWQYTSIFPKKSQVR